MGSTASLGTPCAFVRDITPLRPNIGAGNSRGIGAPGVTSLVPARHKHASGTARKSLTTNDYSRQKCWNANCQGACASFPPVMNPLLREAAAGRDWQIATLTHRREFCARMQTHRPDEAQLLRSLDALLGGHSGAGRDLRLTEAVAMVVKSWPDADPAGETDLTARD
jgi:hypothetical protein